MNSILIIGASSSGKSTTMKEVCRQLKPQEVFKFCPDKNNPAHSSREKSSLEDILNNTFIINVNNKNILIASGSPTEQGIPITILVECCIQIGITIDFAIVNMRSFEKMEGYNTKKELTDLGKIVLIEKIHRINSQDFYLDSKWIERVNKIVQTTLNNL